MVDSSRLQPQLTLSDRASPRHEHISAGVPFSCSDAPTGRPRSLESRQPWRRRRSPPASPRRWRGRRRPSQPQPRRWPGSRWRWRRRKRLGVRDNSAADDDPSRSDRNECSQHAAPRSICHKLASCPLRQLQQATAIRMSNFLPNCFFIVSARGRDGSDGAEVALQDGQNSGPPSGRLETDA